MHPSVAPIGRFRCPTLRRRREQRSRAAEPTAGCSVTIQDYLRVPAMAAYVPIVLRGSLLQAMARLAVMVVCLLLVCERRKNTSTR